MATLRNTVAGSNLTTALGGAPAANSDIIISEGAPTYSAGTDISTNEQNTFTVAPTFRGQLGTGASPVIVDLSAATYTGKLVYDAPEAGDAYVKAKSGSDIQIAIVERTGRGTFYACGETYTNFSQNAGQTEFGGSCVLVTGYFNGGTTKINDNATAVTTLTARNMGAMQIERQITTSYFYNCPSVRFDSYADSLVTVTIDNSTVVYTGTTITQLYGYGDGVLDLRQAVANQTITDATIDRNFRVLMPVGFTVTFTNTPTFPNGKPDWWQ